MRILKFLLGLFVVLMLFQINNPSIYAKEIGARDSYEMVRETAEKIYETIIKLMEWSTDFHVDYETGDRCFPTDSNEDESDEYVRLLKFSSKETANQPKNEYEKNLFNELLSHNGKITEIHRENDGKFYYISLTKTSNRNCYACHDESEASKKFGAIGAMSIKISVD